jgi:hypothetical protein
MWNALSSTTLDSVPHPHHFHGHGVLQCTTLFLGDRCRFTRTHQTSLEVQVLPEGKRLSFREKAESGKRVNASTTKILTGHGYSGQW